jgi:hypothetical protein
VFGPAALMQGVLSMQLLHLLLGRLGCVMLAA